MIYCTSSQSWFIASILRSTSTGSQSPGEKLSSLKFSTNPGNTLELFLDLGVAIFLSKMISLWISILYTMRMSYSILNSFEIILQYHQICLLVSGIKLLGCDTSLLVTRNSIATVSKTISFIYQLGATISVRQSIPHNKCIENYRSFLPYGIYRIYCMRMDHPKY